MTTPWREPVDGAPAPPTRESIGEDLRAIGVERGQTLLVHASMRAMGWVCGGATAAVQALLDVLGPDGTLAVPTFTSDNRDPSRWTATAVPEAWWPVIRQHLPGFDPALTPGQGMGAISEQVRTWPGAARSDHPHVSFAAVGPRAADIVSGHELTCHLGERSPLRKLEDADARVLLLGVGWERCTAFHLAEYRQPRPPVREYSGAVLGPQGRQWVTFEDVDLDQSDFALIGADFEATGAGSGAGTGAGGGPQGGGPEITAGAVGGAPSRRFPLRAAVGHATGWMSGRRRRGAGTVPSHE